MPTKPTVSDSGYKVTWTIAIVPKKFYRLLCGLMLPGMN